MDNNQKRNVCPLLKDPDLYNPDTIDLTNNVKERNYWLPCLEQMVKRFVSKASSLNPDNPNATKNAEICFQKFRTLVDQLKADPTILKPLCVRTLLEFNEDNLRKNNFKDAWLLQKEKESERAFKEFSNTIASIDSIKIEEDKWLELVKGVLAANFFDWGSSAVSIMLENSKDFDLEQAKRTIEERPWFRDDLDCWIKQLIKRPYKKVVIFVDNSGVDFILGILPLTRELLSQGAKVILSANSAPALNDVTYRELNLHCQRAAEFCGILRSSLANGQLLSVENGQKGPCLDLANISSELCSLMFGADLVILEGMGRAVHTNLYAEFKVDVVKVAVLKNEWLAQSLGARQFSVIFAYEAAETE